MDLASISSLRPSAGQPSRWKLAQARDSAAAPVALRELAGSYWYCVYAWWRRTSLGRAEAASATLASFSHWLSDAPPQPGDRGSGRMREWLMARLAELSHSRLESSGEPTVALDREWAEARYADEPEGAAAAIFQRRWALTVLEFAESALQAEYVARGEAALFEEVLPFAGFEEADEDRYAAAAARTGRTSGAMRKAVFAFRTRQRELLRAVAGDTIADPAEIESEIAALLIACDAAGPQAANAPLPTVLYSVQPDHLLARALNSVKMSSAGTHGWMPPTAAEVARLFPNYEVVSMLGRGGMGAVYAARQTSLDRLVAIKLLPLEISVDPDFADRFRREARAMARLNHPNIIAVHDFGQTSEGHLYFAMEFVEGANLHDLIHKSAEPLPPAEALRLIAQVCDALAYAHGKGIVHRDIKPANVMVEPEGRVKVADFGLARIAEANPEQWGSTMTGVVMGTPDYMSPEQKRGLHVDHRTDIYALGVMLYEALCRETPQGAFALPSKHCGLDRRLDGIITKALASQPEARFQSTEEMKTAIETIRPAVAKAQARKSPPARAVAPRAVRPLVQMAPPAAPAPKSKLPLIWGVAAALALIAGATILLSKPNRQAGRQKGAPGPAQKAAESPPAPVDQSGSVAKPTAPAAVAAAVLSPAASAPAPPPAKQTIDLMAELDPVKDRLQAKGLVGANEWQRTSDGKLLFNAADGKAGKICAPVSLRGVRDYEVAFSSSNTPGSGPTRTIELPLSLHHQATVDFMFGGPIQIASDEKQQRVDIGNWPARVHPNAPIAVRVKFDTGDDENGTIEARVDGKLVGTWRGKLTALGEPAEQHAEFPGELLPALFSRNQPRVYTAWTLQVFEGEARALRRQAPAAVPGSSVAAATPGPGPAPAAPAPQSATGKWLAQQEAQWQETFAKEVIAPFEQGVADLKKQYLTAVEKQLAAVTKAARLEDAVVFRAERERITGSGEVPAEDEALAPEALKNLRTNYRTALARLDHQRFTKAKSVHARYDPILGQSQTALTQRERLDEALEVKTKREELSVAWLKPPAASLSPPTVRVATPDRGNSKPPRAETNSPPPAKTPKLKPKELVERLLEMGATVVGATPGSPFTTVEEIAHLPGEKFVIDKVVFLKPREGLTEAELDILVQLGDITDLHLSEVPATDAAIERLRSLPRLRALTLRKENKVTDTGFKSIAAMPALTTLELQMPVTTEHLSALGKARQLKNLTLAKHSFTVEEFAAVAALPEVTSLKIITNVAVPAGAWARLTEAKNLVSLSVDSTPKNAAMIAEIGRLTGLESLSLGNVTLPDAVLAPLGALKSLHTFRTNINSTVDGTVFTTWPLRPAMQVLTLKSQMSVNDDSVRAIVTAFPKLTMLELMAHAGTLTPTGLAHLTRLRQLERLWLNGDAVDDAGLAHVAKCNQLMYLGIGKARATEVGVQSLSKCSALSDLEWTNPPVTDAALKSYGKLRALQTFFIGPDTSVETENTLKAALPKVKISRQR